LLLNWVKSNTNGKPAPFLPPPHSFKTTAAMNAAFCEKHQVTSGLQAQQMLKTSHTDVMAVIESFSNDELFAKNTFSWTGTTTLGSYCVSATASHYDWAIKKIKKCIKENGCTKTKNF